MKLIKTKLKNVRKGGKFRFMAWPKAREFKKGRRDCMKKKTWCEAENNAIAVEPNKLVYVKSVDELKRNVGGNDLEIIYV